MISQDQKQKAYEALRAAGFEPPLARELLAGPKGLRDEFAGQAMTAFVAQGDMHHAPNREMVALLAYSVADAMIKRRSE